MKKNAKQVKTVLDTNILISGLFSRKGTIAELMMLLFEGNFKLVISEDILSELFKVFHKPSVQKHFKPVASEIDEYIEGLRETAIITPGLYQTNRITKDPSDNMFLVSAKESLADFIVSGDKHILEVKQFYKTKIVTAREFVKSLR